MSEDDLKLQSLWKTALGELEVVISSGNFNTWFPRTILDSVKDGVYTVGTPDFFIRDEIKKRYPDIIKTALFKASGEEPKEVKIKVVSIERMMANIIPKKKVIHSPVDNFPPEKTPNTTQVIKQKIFDDPQNYSFENFVVGANNRLAHAAAMAVAENPGNAYNPLYIYGPSGMGKTHLLKAIQREVNRKFPDKKITYIPSEEFANDFINSIRTDSTSSFRKQYRASDVLIIDDIQFIGGKESTQEEVFHTFNHLHQKKKQLILASDRVPKAIKKLEDRLVTRFEWGMLADIGAPDVETRIAILQEKAKEKGVSIPVEVIKLIARRVKSSIRELEGALNKLIAQASLNRQPISEALAESVLRTVVSSEGSASKKPTKIIKAVCEFYRVHQEDLMGKKRGHEIIRPRQVCMYLMRYEGQLSFPEIGKEMGGRDHTTCLYGCECIEKNLATNDEVKNELNLLKEKLRGN